MNEIKTCNKCFNSEELVSKLKELDKDAKIIIGCQSMCAVGSKMPFAIVNGIPVMANTVDEVVERCKQCLK